MHLWNLRLEVGRAVGVHNCSFNFLLDQLQIDIGLVDGNVRKVKHVGYAHGAGVSLSPDAEIVVLSVPESVAIADFLQGDINLSVNCLVDHARSNVAIECDILSFCESAHFVFLETFSLESDLFDFVFEIIVLLVPHVDLILNRIIWVNLIHWLRCIRFDNVVVLFPVGRVLFD